MNSREDVALRFVQDIHHLISGFSLCQTKKDDGGTEDEHESK
jgi:hypothetical protein